METVHRTSLKAIEVGLPVTQQPATIPDAMRGRLSREEATTKLGGLNMTNTELHAVERIVITGCGTTHHPGMVGEYLIEHLAPIPGRQFNFPEALEGALKMKEISYIHANGHSSAELKHGVFIASEDRVYEKNVSNIEEVKARQGVVIAIGTEGYTKLGKIFDDVIYIPPCPDYLSQNCHLYPAPAPRLSHRLQLGYGVDKPRNLAKSVTVE